MISLNGRAVKRGRMVNQTSSQFARAHDTDDFETNIASLAPNAEVTVYPWRDPRS